MWRRGEFEDEELREEVRDLGRDFADDPEALDRFRRILMQAGASTDDL